MRLVEVEPKPAVTDVPEAELVQMELAPGWAGQLERYREQQLEYIARAYGLQVKED